MEKLYKIKTPNEFTVVIEDILAWYESSGQTNLIITLTGDLGAGKTAFTKKLGEYLGVKEVIVSPTFNIMKQYELTNKNFDLLVHIDAYRFEDLSESRPLKLAELITQPRTVFCIEWPEILAELIPKKAVNLKITAGPDEIREVIVSY